MEIQCGDGESENRNERIEDPETLKKFECDVLDSTKRWCAQGVGNTKWWEMISQTKLGYCVKCCGWVEAVFRIQKSKGVEEEVF